MATIGVKLELNGAASFTQSMKQATSEVKLFDAQIKGLSSKMTSAGSAFSRHQQTTEALKNKLSALRNEQGLLSQKLDEAKAKYGENSTQANNYATKLENVNQKIIATENSLKAQGGTLGAVGAQFQAIGGTLETVGGKLTAFGTKLTTAVTLPLAAVGTKGVQSFAEVSKTMQLTNETMQNTKEEAGLLSNAMKDAAANSTFGMTDAATATLNFARAGLTAKEAADTLAPAMNLAAGEGGNLDTVSAGLVATINGFGDTFTNASTYADIFASACNNSALDIDSLSESMSIAAPIFSSAGYTVKDAALYIGVMADNGIEASEAANSLKTGIARLVAPTKGAAAWLDRLGIEVTNADGTMKDTLTVQKELHDAFATLSESEQLAGASAIFGKNQMAKWLALINASPEDVAALNAELENSAGTTTAMAQAMMSGFGGSMEKLKSSIDVAVTSLGEALAPTISKVAEKIQDLVDWFNSLSSEQQTAVANALLVAAALGPVILVVGKITTGVGKLITNIGLILPKLGLLFTTIGPFLPLILAIVAAVVLIIATIKNWDKICAFFQKTWTTMTTAITNAWNTAKNGVVSKLNELKTNFTEGFNTMKTKASETFDNIKSSVTNKISETKANAIENLSEMKHNFNEKMNDMKSKADSTWQGIKDGLSAKGAEWKEKLSGTLSSMTKAFTDMKDSALTWGKDMIDNFINGVKQKIEDVKNAAKDVAQTVKDILGFSEPKKGPLSNFHTYGPDMMELYSKGIKDYSYLVKDAVNDVALDVSTLGTTNVGGVTMHIYGAEGQSVNELATVIEDKLSASINRREAVFA